MPGFTIKKFIVGYIETNMYLVCNEGAGIVIDPGFIENEKDTVIKKIRRFVNEIPAVFLTHFHFDHISGVPVLKREFGSAIYCHFLDAECLSDPQKNGALFFGVQSESITADKFFTDNQELDLIGLKFRIIHTRGHTPGGVSILLENQYLFSGDTIFKDGIGRTDLFGGDYEAEINSIKTRILTLPSNTLIYPGHGGPTTVEDEKMRFFPS